MLAAAAWLAQLAALAIEVPERRGYRSIRTRRHQADSADWSSGLKLADHPFDPKEEIERGPRTHMLLVADGRHPIWSHHYLVRIDHWSMFPPKQ